MEPRSGFGAAGGKAIRMKRTVAEKIEIRKAIIRRCVTAWPAGVSLRELQDEIRVAPSDGRTLEGELRRLITRGVLEALVSSEGRALRATDTAARAVLWAAGKEARE